MCSCFLDIFRGVIKYFKCFLRMFNSINSLVSYQCFLTEIAFPNKVTLLRQWIKLESELSLDFLNVSLHLLISPRSSLWYHYPHFFIQIRNSSFIVLEEQKKSFQTSRSRRKILANGFRSERRSPFVIALIFQSQSEF